MLKWWLVLSMGKKIHKSELWKSLYWITWPKCVPSSIYKHSRTNFQIYITHSIRRQARTKAFVGCIVTMGLMTSANPFPQRQKSIVLWSRNEMKNLRHTRRHWAKVLWRANCQNVSTKESIPIISFKMIESYLICLVLTTCTRLQAKGMNTGFLTVSK